MFRVESCRQISLYQNGENTPSDGLYNNPLITLQNAQKMNMSFELNNVFYYLSCITSSLEYVDPDARARARAHAQPKSDFNATNTHVYISLRIHEDDGPYGENPLYVITTDNLNRMYNRSKYYWYSLFNYYISSFNEYCHPHNNARWKLYTGVVRITNVRPCIWRCRIYPEMYTEVPEMLRPSNLDESIYNIYVDPDKFYRAFRLMNNYIRDHLMMRTPFLTLVRAKTRIMDLIDSIEHYESGLLV